MELRSNQIELLIRSSLIHKLLLRHYRNNDFFYSIKTINSEIEN